jgi:hypothetical protein
MNHELKLRDKKITGVGVFNDVTPTVECCEKGSWSSMGLGSWEIQWKPLIMITFGPALFDNNNRLITLIGEYKNLHCLTELIVTFYMYKKQQNLFKNLCSVACCLFAFSSS